MCIWEMMWKRLWRGKDKGTSVMRDPIWLHRDLVIRLIIYYVSNNTYVFNTQIGSNWRFSVKTMNSSSQNILSYTCKQKSKNTASSHTHTHTHQRQCLLITDMRFLKGARQTERCPLASWDPQCPPASLDWFSHLITIAPSWSHDQGGSRP